MKRYLCCLAVLGVVAVPDWASAFHPCWAPPPPCAPSGYGYYSPPTAVYPHQLVLVPPYAPYYEVPLPAPQVYPVAPVATASPSPAPAPNRDADKVTPIPTVHDTQPAGPAAPTASVAAPTPAPAPATNLDPVRPAGMNTTAPAGPPRVDPTHAPREDTLPAKPPALVLPMIPGATDPKPAAMIPGSTDPKTPGPGAPSAVPSPAPPPALELGPAIPPTSPKLPPSPEPKKLDVPGETLPPLTLPPETSASPSGIVPSAGPSISRSSPLTGGVKVQVFTAAGAPPSTATRKVSFFNHTEKDIALVIEGRAVTLPRKTFIHAQLPPVFSWKRSNNPTETTTVPAGAAGLDVLFRE